MFTQVKIWLCELSCEDGVETIEWIGLAAVVLALLGAVAAVFARDRTVGRAITAALRRVIGRIR